MPEKMKTPTNVSSGKRAQLDFIKELGETGDEIERIRKRKAMRSRQQIKYDGHLESGEELEELLGNMTPDQLADLKDKISQMQEKDAAESENEEVDKDADVDDASKDADTDDTDAAEGAAEKTVTADTKSE